MSPPITAHSKPEKITIYDFPSGPFPSRVRIALHEKGLTELVDFIFIDLFKGEHKSAEFQSQVNYSKKLPVVKFADGTLLTESVAITQWLDNITGEPTLTGRTPLEQGTIHMMTRLVENEFLEPISQYFHNATPGLGPTVETYQNNDWGLHNREIGLNGLHYLNGLLKKQPYIAGENFSMADLAVVAAVIFMSFAKLDFPKDCDAFSAWFERVRARPTVKKYLEEFQPDAVNW